MIAVIGGAGYIGSHTVKYLLEQSQEVVVFDNLSEGHKETIPSGIPFLQGDVGSTADVHTLFTKYPTIHTVIHFAAHAYVGESVKNPAKYYQNNVVNTMNLLHVMREFDVKRIVFSSTCATYGIPHYIPIDEVHPQQPINPYGRTKWIVEQILEDYRRAYGIHYIALRYFNAAGASLDTSIGELHDPETHLIPLVLDVALGKSESITVFGDDYDTPDGTCIRDYIHVTDLAQAHALAVEQLQHQKSDVYNLGNGNGYSVLEVIRTAKEVTGKEIPMKMAERRVGDPAILVGSADKAKKQLHWKPQHTDLHAIINSAWNWHNKMNRGTSS
ncbi:UDP-glucose 4-epimerase GalE [Sporosarcina sp. PTS2304]|uniref:UDP-glucose 4-epimerase GalE n=1 Tax=Sporosarcina sp. PTS2304 TaxID=2283194 RepID=UPI000E0D18EB|nr:UDP-glucose 4-epimerase GalE [Sporosarcina sp. PTS2304]AXH98424.1 UDP-glucose 4-epimerase GalE [Sporosarcina sp. PTS2304]